MITNPTRQHTLRVARADPAPVRGAVSAERLARVAGLLTDRDRWLLRMVHEHRVLTSAQIIDLAFTSPRAGRRRLGELHRWGLLDRFQPAVHRGSAPVHHVLGPVGAAVLAAEHDLTSRQIGYRRDRALAVAHRLTLAHLLGVNEWFTALIHHARTHTHDSRGDDHGSHPPENRAGTETGSVPAVLAWWSETRCGRYFGDLAHPDAYGRWSHHGATVEFFLEFDLGTEALRRVAGKLAGYADLARTTGVITPVVFWFPTTRRELNARALLRTELRGLADPDAVPVATAAADRLRLTPEPDDGARAGIGAGADAALASPHPAQALWAAVTPGDPAHDEPARVALHQLPSSWVGFPNPFRTGPSADQGDPQSPPPSGPPGHGGLLPAPDPMPPSPNNALGRRTR